MIEIMSKSHIYKLKVFVEDVDFGRVFYSRYLQVRLNLLQEVKRSAEVLVSAEVELAVVDRSGSIKKLNKDFFEKI